ncbi:hypothetical protein M3J09_011288 [Ascochyta lentis]
MNGYSHACLNFPVWRRITTIAVAYSRTPLAQPSTHHQHPSRRTTPPSLSHPNETHRTPVPLPTPHPPNREKTNPIPSRTTPRPVLKGNHIAHLAPVAPAPEMSHVRAAWRHATVASDIAIDSVPRDHMHSILLFPASKHPFPALVCATPLCGVAGTWFLPSFLTVGIVLYVLDTAERTKRR